MYMVYLPLLLASRVICTSTTYHAAHFLELKGLTMPIATGCWCRLQKTCGTAVSEHDQRLASVKGPELSTLRAQSPCPPAGNRSLVSIPALWRLAISENYIFYALARLLRYVPRIRRHSTMCLSRADRNREEERRGRPFEEARGRPRQRRDHFSK